MLQIFYIGCHRRFINKFTKANEMTLAFSIELNGKKTMFVEKILSGLRDFENFEGFTLSDIYKHDLDYLETAIPKIHTIRSDRAKRWKKGNSIHFVINNRTKNRFQFVSQTFPVISTQMIWIRPSNKSILVEKHINTDQSWNDTFYWHELSEEEKVLLMVNDGFDDDLSFWEYFNREFAGVIICWTDYKY